MTSEFSMSPTSTRPGIFFVVATSSIYGVSEWVKYELALTPTSPPQSLFVQMIEWGPTLVTQICALAAILGTIVLIMSRARRLFRDPSKCTSPNRVGRLVGSCCSGVMALSLYFLGVMTTFALWKFDSSTYQLGIVTGMQFPLFRVWRVFVR